MLLQLMAVKITMKIVAMSMVLVIVVMLRHGSLDDD